MAPPASRRYGVGTLVATVLLVAFACGIGLGAGVRAEHVDEFYGNPGSDEWVRTRVERDDVFGEFADHITELEAEMNVLSVTPKTGYYIGGEGGDYNERRMHALRARAARGSHPESYSDADSDEDAHFEKRRPEDRPRPMPPEPGHPLGEPDAVYYARVVNTNRVVELNFGAGAEPDLVTGDIVRLRVREPDVSATGARRLRSWTDVYTGGAGTGDGDPPLDVLSYRVKVPNPSRDFSYGAATVNITSITWLIKACGQVSVPNATAFKQRWTNDQVPDGGKTAPTMQNYYGECSFGKVRFDGSNNVVVDLTGVDMPCTLTWQNQVANWSRCGTPEIYGWQEWALNYTTQVLKMNVTRFTRRVLFLPNNPACPWAGLASVGCGKTCYTWMKTTDQAATFHELGHNLGMQHSSTPTQEYGDASCPMGGCCSVRCLNAPHGYQVGWFEPLKVINASTFGIGTWSAYVLPATQVHKRNYIHVVPNWRAGKPTTPAYFVSFRQPVNQDRTLLGQYQGTVHLHEYNGTQTINGHKPVLQAMIPLGTNVTRTPVDIAIRHLRGNATHALVQICRYTTPANGTAANATRVEDNCNDGLDNDCDGLVDAADPDCAGKTLPATCNNNGVCDRALGETSVSCPADCKPVCGDLTCGPGETVGNCEIDCWKTLGKCGDCICSTYANETALSCPMDCPPFCGDGRCEYARGEGPERCPQDCPVTCPDGFCDTNRARPGRPAWDTEFGGNCPQDCPQACGDYYCDDRRGENSINCIQDCAVRCGDRVCDQLHGENATNCATDCLNPVPPRLAPPSPPPRPPSPVFRCPRTDYYDSTDGPVEFVTKNPYVPGGGSSPSTYIPGGESGSVV